MAGVTVKVSGADEAARALRKLGIDVADGLEAICHAGAAVVEDAIAAKAPGDIAKEIGRATDVKSKRRIRVVTGPSKDAFYARFLEYGVTPHSITLRQAQALRLGPDLFRRSVNHPGHAARPFMRPAFDGSRDRAQGEIAGAIRKKVRRAG